MNCIKVKRNNLLNSIYSSVSPDFSFKETPFVNFFTDPELSSSLYHMCADKTDDRHWVPREYHSPYFVRVNRPHHYMYTYDHMLRGDRQDHAQRTVSSFSQHDLDDSFEKC